MSAFEREHRDCVLAPMNGASSRELFSDVQNPRLLTDSFRNVFFCDLSLRCLRIVHFRVFARFRHSFLVFFSTTKKNRILHTCRCPRLQSLLMSFPSNQTTPPSHSKKSFMKWVELCENIRFKQKKSAYNQMTSYVPNRIEWPSHKKKSFCVVLNDSTKAINLFVTKCFELLKYDTRILSRLKKSPFHDRMICALIECTLVQPCISLGHFKVHADVMARCMRTHHLLHDDMNFPKEIAWNVCNYVLRPSCLCPACTQSYEVIPPT